MKSIIRSRKCDSNVERKEMHFGGEPVTGDLLKRPIWRNYVKQDLTTRPNRLSCDVRLHVYTSSLFSVDTEAVRIKSSHTSFLPLLLPLILPLNLLPSPSCSASFFFFPYSRTLLVTISLCFSFPFSSSPFHLPAQLKVSWVLKLCFIYCLEISFLIGKFTKFSQSL
jgi:hypothetical protein